ncbi:hypothetical protein FB480_101852 [Agrobacterium vitis]|nr:hypothetical protein FB480_101852 [Agrobacterium vitis]
MADAAKTYASAEGVPVARPHIMAAHGLLSNALRQEFDAAMSRGYIEVATVEDTSASVIFPAMPTILPPSSGASDDPAKENDAATDHQPTDATTPVEAEPSSTTTEAAATESETAATDFAAVADDTATDAAVAPAQTEEKATAE